jgi:hypothetical protein
MSTYPPQAVQDAANKLMGALALHEDSRGTVTDHLADAYDAGGNDALRAAIPASLLDELSLIREQIERSQRGDMTARAAVYYIDLAVRRIADGLDLSRAEHVTLTEDTSCRVCGDQGQMIDDGTGKPYALCGEDDQAHDTVREGIARMRRWQQATPGAPTAVADAPAHVLTAIGRLGDRLSLYADNETQELGRAVADLARGHATIAQASDRLPSWELDGLLDGIADAGQPTATSNADAAGWDEPLPAHAYSDSDGEQD